MDEFFSTIKQGATMAASVAADLAQSAAATTAQAFEKLKAPPTSVQCSGCAKNVDVPIVLWNWRCAEQHDNGNEDNTCRTCNGARLASPNPIVTCPDCQATTEVPRTYVMEQLRNVPVNTKKAVLEASQSIKKEVADLRAFPKEFKCVHCQTLLGVPQVPWTCTTCQSGLRNPPEAEICASCNGSRPRQKVRCGVCQQSTPVPSSNFEKGLRDVSASAQESAKLAYYTVSNTPTLTCTRCSHVTPAAEAGAGRTCGQCAAPFS